MIACLHDRGHGLDEKARRHVVAYGHYTWQRVSVHASMYACVHKYVCEHVCARARACEEREKLPFQDNAISLICTYFIYARVFLFLSCGTLFSFKHAQVMWQHEESPIRAINEDH